VKVEGMEAETLRRAVSVELNSWSRGISKRIDWRGNGTVGESSCSGKERGWLNERGAEGTTRPALAEAVMGDEAKEWRSSVVQTGEWKMFSTLWPRGVSDSSARPGSFTHHTDANFRTGASVWNLLLHDMTA
jgi:hypothetical protein